MEQHNRLAITSNFVDLCEQMDIDGVFSLLIEKHIYKSHQLSKFQAEKGTFNQNQALLTDIVKRGPDAFSALCEALDSAGQSHLKTALENSSEKARLQSVPSNSQNQPSKESQSISHPRDDIQMWPTPDSIESFDGHKIQPSSRDEVITDESKVYRMQSDPRGIAAIISNKDFTKMSARTGTERDAKNLCLVFTELGFNVDVKSDMTANSMKKFIKNLAEMDHSGFDCFILVILSHGIEGAVYGTDVREVRIDEDILAPFEAGNSPSLKNKPKLFFLQACRGEKFDHGEKVDTIDGEIVGEEIDEDNKTFLEGGTGGDCKLSEKEENELVEKMVMHELDETDAVSTSYSKIPSRSDMLIAYATVPGFVSWRNAERGSWFIQALCEVLMEEARKEDLISMVTTINRKVALAFASSTGQCKQMPAPVHMLTKKLFFNPGVTFV